MGYRIQNRRDTAERWAEVNPILLEGEVGYATDNPNQYKIGDGIHRWNDLPLRGYTGTIAQEFGNDENAVVSQKAVTEKFSELGKDVGIIENFIGAKSYEVEVSDTTDNTYYILHSSDALNSNNYFNTSVSYYEVLKDVVYNLTIPKSGNGVMAQTAYCQEIKQLRGYEVFGDAGTSGAVNRIFTSEHNGYLAVVYETDFGVPTLVANTTSIQESISNINKKTDELNKSVNEISPYIRLFELNNDGGMYEATNYALFVDIINNKKYNINTGAIEYSDGTNITTLAVLDRDSDIYLASNGYCSVHFFDIDNKYISSRENIYYHVGVKVEEFPINAYYVAFTFKTSYFPSGEFSTFKKRNPMGLKVPCKIRKVKGTRPTVYIYRNDSETDIFKKLVQVVIAEDCNVIWEHGTYIFSDIYIDMVDIFGYGDVQGSFQRELPIGGNCVYDFCGSTIIGNMPNNLVDAKVFGNVRSALGDYELRNVTIISNDMVYCVHDEGNALDGFYSHRYVNVNMETNRTAKAVRCIGGGTGKFGNIVIDSCVFKTNNTDADVAYHGITESIDDDCDFTVYVKNSHFTNSVQVNTLSANQKGKLMCVSNSFGKSPIVLNGWVENSWGNVIRE